MWPRISKVSLNEKRSHKTGKVSGVFWEDFLEGDIDSVVAHVLKIYGRSADYATATIEIKETQYTVKVYRSEIQ